MPHRKESLEDPVLSRVLRLLSNAPLADIDLLSELAALAGSYKKLLHKFHKTLVISDSYEAQHQEMARKLETATRQYRQLKEVALPICMYCKKIRTDDDYWQKLETFFCKNAGLVFSHGVCPECLKTAYSKMGLSTEEIPPSVSPLPSKRASREPVEDDALRDMRALIERFAHEGAPLPPEVTQFAEKYGKLLRRFNKIVTISDSYQSQMMELNARLELIAKTDLLTGLINRWETMARLEAEKSRSERHGSPFSVVIADIDYFKRTNDIYGHLAGDRVLRAVAETLRSNLRGEDSCGRWGGEEFLIILPETDLERAGKVAAKLLAKVRSLTVPWEDRSVTITVSMGYGMFEPGSNIDAFLQRVDDALYAAKANGRDRAEACGDKTGSFRET